MAGASFAARAVAPQRTPVGAHVARMSALRRTPAASRALCSSMLSTDARRRSGRQKGDSAATGLSLPHGGVTPGAPCLDNVTAARGAAARARLPLALQLPLQLAASTLTCRVLNTHRCCGALATTSSLWYVRRAAAAAAVFALSCAPPPAAAADAPCERAYSAAQECTRPAPAAAVAVRQSRTSCSDAATHDGRQLARARLVQGKRKGERGRALPRTCAACSLWLGARAAARTCAAKV
jgi:hypothetical protein